MGNFGVVPCIILEKPVIKVSLSDFLPSTDETNKANIS